MLLEEEEEEEEVKCYVCSDCSMQCSQQDCNLHQREERRTYSFKWLPACVSVFILWSVVAFLFRVLCETERLPENDSLKPDPAVR